MKGLASRVRRLVTSIRWRLAISAVVVGVVLAVLAMFWQQTSLAVVAAAAGLLLAGWTIVKELRAVHARPRPHVYVFGEFGVGFGAVNEASTRQKAEIAAEEFIQTEVERLRSELAAAPADFHEIGRRRINAYANELREWLPLMQQYLEGLNGTVSMLLRFCNRGEAAMENVEVVLSLPEELQAWGRPEPPVYPARPQMDAAGLAHDPLSPPVRATRPSERPGHVEGPVAGNWIPEVGQAVTYTVPVIYGGSHVDTIDPHLLTVLAGNGTFEIGWQMRDKAASASGTLKLTVHGVYEGGGEALRFASMMDLDLFMIGVSHDYVWQDHASAQTPRCPD